MLREDRPLHSLSDSEHQSLEVDIGQYFLLRL
jgi:hypothetical protein